MSEVIQEDEDRGGDGAIGEALEETESGADAPDALDDEGGEGADDGGPGSRNM